jgi:hypothetical protein
MQTELRSDEFAPALADPCYSFVDGCPRKYMSARTEITQMSCIVSSRGAYFSCRYFSFEFFCSACIICVKYICRKRHEKQMDTEL